MDKKTEETRYYVKGAMGFCHSVPASKLEQFQREQKELEESGELMRKLELLAAEAAKLQKKKP